MTRPVALIPARGGSKRIPRKNVADLGGRPLLSYAVETCLNADLFAEVIVSTEDAAIADTARAWGASVDTRPADLATDRCPATHVLAELLTRRYDTQTRPESFCLVYPMAAFILAEDLAESLALLDGCDAVLGVSRYDIHPYKALVERDGHLVALWPEKNLQQSNSYPDTMASNGTFCWLRTAPFLETPTLYPPDLKGYVMPSERAVDIDVPEDLERARKLMRLKALDAV